MTCICNHPEHEHLHDNHHARECGVAGCDCQRFIEAATSRIKNKRTSMTTQELAEQYIKNNEKTYGSYRMNDRAYIHGLVERVIREVREQAMKEQREKIEFAYVSGFSEAESLLSNHHRDIGLFNAAKEWFDKQFPAIRKEE